MRLALVHDYITQLGGAERVVLSMLKAFPGAPVHTSLYEPSMTYPEFQQADVRPLAVNRIRSLRTHHRRALPLLAPSFDRLQLDDDVVLCSSSGWAHGVKTTGLKVVYCHSPARWLYQTQAYLGSERTMRSSARGIAIRGLRRQLEGWDKRASASADVFLANSNMVRSAIQEIYGRDAEVVAPPPALTAVGPQQAIDGVEPGFFLCVSRLLPYKNVDAIVAAFAGRSDRLVVVGAGPDRDRLTSFATSNVHFAGTVNDSELRWLYANCQALVSASYEDYGLTPLEAATFGKPSVALRWGGFLDNIVEGKTGVFIEAPTADAVSNALSDFAATRWEARTSLALAERRSEARFIARLREIVGVEERKVITLPDAPYPSSPVVTSSHHHAARPIRLPDAVGSNFFV